MTSSPTNAQDTMVANLETDEQSARRLADLVTESLAGDDVAVSLVGIGQGQWRVAIFCRPHVNESDIRDLVDVAAGMSFAKALAFERLAEKDWVGLSLAGLKPVAAGRFVVHGAHDRCAVPPSRIGIEIEVALAFGTGHHGTTRGCLLALDWLCATIGQKKRARPFPSPCKGEGQGGGRYARRPNKMTPTRLASARRPPPFRGRSLKILDLGTGSGVLAIAAARALHRPVLASDIDAVSVRAARDNVRLNRAGPLVELVRANGLAAPAIRAQAPFDLVFANILLAPLQRLAAPLTKLVAPGGRVVLSGLLVTQANAARAAYGALRLERRITLDGWTTLVLKRGR